MYLAKKHIDNQPCYFIRESYRDGDVIKSRDLFDLGPDPSQFIIYPGGKGYYFDDVIETSLQNQGLDPSQDELDTIFWDFLDPEIKRTIRGFERKTKKTDCQEHLIDKNIHIFDKRRVYFLKFGTSGRGNVHRMPIKLCSPLVDKSRDEVEQYFMHQEIIIRPQELRRYLLSIFDAKQHVSRTVLEKVAEDLQQGKIDDHFLECVCNLNEDKTFWKGMPSTDGLQEYLRRYVILYFDSAIHGIRPIPRYLHEFINRHRQYQPPRKVRVSMAEAGHLFETTWENLKQMDTTTFTRLYRKLALKHHPDQGGSQETFVKLSKLYEKILRKKKER